MTRRRSATVRAFRLASHPNFNPPHFPSLLRCTDAHSASVHGAQVPCTYNCKVNSECYLRQHFPQRVVFITPHYAESRLRTPEFLAAPGAIHPGLHALQGLCKIAIQNCVARTPNQGYQKIAGWSAQRHHRNRSPRCSQFESARMHGAQVPCTELRCRAPATFTRLLRIDTSHGD